jgi:radical SAM superfamily enzyme YgiQ (UPF0313 family)
VTRNCPWNRCAFCHTYQGESFSLRPVSEIKEDILRMAVTAERIRTVSVENGEGGRIGGKTFNRIFSREGNDDECLRSVAAWLYYGGESVFLQDADSLIIKTDDLAEVISFIRKTFPPVPWITTYSRAKTAARKTVEDLKRLREAGLSRIHTGMETGYDPLLEFIRKGMTAAEQVEGGQKIREAGSGSSGSSTASSPSPVRRGWSSVWAGGWESIGVSMISMTVAPIAISSSF